MHLSILDKIVSFSNGEVTYQNTLEHLNILDEDYYFRLLESLMQQDLAEAMLLYDEINRKGFEGDLVVNGFASFIRNLLVCKDAKAANLLDVVEGMQSKYVENAKKVEPSFLISALNILNDTEINYKMARNKRLHVELAIIKLNFLQQSIELSNDNGVLVKKKRLDSPVAFKTKTLHPWHTKIPLPAKKEATLIIEENIQRPTPVEKQVLVPNSPNGEYKPQATKKGLLNVLRDRYGSEYVIEEVKEPEPLNLEKLQFCWNDYGRKLEEEQKHSSSNTFKSARLKLIDTKKFEVQVDAVTRQKFIEHEKMLLNDFIQKAFNNRFITFDIVVQEGEKQEMPEYMTLNSRERFERIAADYPIVRELKERLKLEIDY